MPQTCETLQDSTENDWTYCITPSPGSSSRDVIYHFTGMSESSDAWSVRVGDDGTTPSEYEALRQQWEARREKYERGIGSLPGNETTCELPTVVTVTINDGTTGLYLYGSERRAFFIQTLLPAIEKRLGFVPTKRHLFGHSMGAFNAIQIAQALGGAGNLGGLALGCPMFTTLSSNSTDADQSIYARANACRKDDVAMLVAGLKDNYPDANAWKAADPLHIVASEFPLLSIFVSPNFDDSYGLFEGAFRFVQLARISGHSVTFAPRPGKHCDLMDGAAIADFLFSTATKTPRRK